jgi:hypothetical protein
MRSEAKRGAAWAVGAALAVSGCAPGDVGTSGEDFGEELGAGAGETDSAAADAPKGDEGPAALVLNEILAVNEGAWPVDGATPDGVELYYAGSTPLDLQGYSLSDDPEDPTLHTFTEPWVLAPGAFVVLWADEGARGGPDSLPFALSAGGDALILTDPEGRRLDAVRFGEQAPDVALARVVDGDEASGWAYVQGGTPGASNAGLGQP